MLKPSHFTTPRTMDEACFIPAGAAIERCETHGAFHHSDKIVLWGCVFAVACLAVLALVKGGAV